jgi:hypothetical protein
VLDEITEKEIPKEPKNQNVQQQEQHVPQTPASVVRRYTRLSIPPERYLIQVDIEGHPPFPNGSKQFSGHFGNLLFLAGFNFRGHFKGLNEVFSRYRFSMIVEGMIEPPK